MSDFIETKKRGQEFLARMLSAIDNADKPGEHESQTRVVNDMLDYVDEVEDILIAVRRRNAALEQELEACRAGRVKWSAA